jgi:hypothetical protein
MNLYEFGDGIEKLENCFGALKSEDTRKIYFERLKNVPENLFSQAINKLLDTHQYARFPLISEILEVIKEIRDESRESTPEEREELSYCQQCNNLGFYLGEDERALFCSCIRGRKKQAAWMKVKLSSLPPATPPIRGLKEWNPETRSWEDTKEEHEKWCERKIKQIVEMDKRIAEREAKKEAAKKHHSEGALRRILDETLNQIKESKKGINDDEAEVPF